MKASSAALSVVVPLYNEVENTPLLVRRLTNVLGSLGQSYEIVLVDDGSRDGTREELRRLVRQIPHLKIILLRRNFGQSSAMAAGFRRVRGEIMITMDGDLQNDPRDIPKLLKKMAEGFDVVSGWRKDRKDTLILRKVPSRLANRLICKITGVRLHDTGCALKAYRREVVQHIRLYGELHRFLPALARVEGARISEIVVQHHHRRFGKSKYNITRTFRVLMDLISLNLFINHLTNPLRFFGKIGVWFFLLGGAGIAYAAYRMLADRVPFIDMNVMITAVFLFLVAGFQFVFLGLVAGLIVKTGDRRGGALAPLEVYSGQKS